MLGKYERLDVLGHGASGIVYLAKDTLLGRQIALKEIAAQGEERERVLEEARVLDRLRHPNIVQVFGVDEIGGKVVLAMEYVRGQNLQEILRRSPQLPVAEAVDIAAQVCDGLAFAHRHRTVHRDIKPANILIAQDGTVKLVDFGLAQVLGTNSFAGGAGTYAYMAPEDFHEEQQSDHQADIWAVGVILYEMLTGRRPFQAVKTKDPFSWKRAVEEAPLIPVAELRAGVSPALDAVLSHALARDKHDRYTNAAEMAEDLRALAEPLPPRFGLPPSPFPGEEERNSGSIRVPPDPPRSREEGWQADPEGALKPEGWASWTLLPGQPPLTDIDAFLRVAPDHWDAARAALAGGALTHWLAEIGEMPLAEVARQITADPDAGRDADDKLRDFLYRAGLDTVPEARRAYEDGVRLARAARFAEAVPLFRRASRLDPTRPAYHQDLAGALRAGGDHAAAALALEHGMRYHPRQRTMEKEYADLTGAQTVLSSDTVDFGTLRQGQSRSAVLWVRNAGGGALQGRVAAAPGWIRVDPPAFTTRQRQRLVFTADAAGTGGSPAEFRETVVLETNGGRQEVAVRASVVPARRAFAQIFWWYVPLLVCCLLPALAGWYAPTVIPHGWARQLWQPGMAAAALLCGALFVLTAAADTTWGPRLWALGLLGLNAMGGLSVAHSFQSGGPSQHVEVALIQTAAPALVLLALQSVSVYADPHGWGRWPLWAWITAATGLLIGYALLHMGVR